jgi:hypothetical protein
MVDPEKFGFMRDAHEITARITEGVWNLTFYRSHQQTKMAELPLFHTRFIITQLAEEPEADETFGLPASTVSIPNFVSLSLCREGPPSIPLRRRRRTVNVQKENV